MATFIFLGCRASSMEVDTMKCRLVNFIFVLLLSLVAVTAMAEQCKPVHAQLGQMVFHDPGCVLDGVTYYWCAERPITGTLNGTYYFYSAPEFNGWDLEVPDGAMGASWWIVVGVRVFLAAITLYFLGQVIKKTAPVDITVSQTDSSSPEA